jgi:hypothetical protein
MGFIVGSIFDRLIGSMIERTASAAKTRAEQETIGKAEAKVMGAQAKVQQKALRGMDKVVDGSKGKAKGAWKKRKGGDADAAVEVQGQAAPYQPVNANYQAQPVLPVGAGAPVPEAAANMNHRMCPNGHPLDPSWEVCPYCRQAEAQGVKPVHVQADGGGAVAGKTMAVSLDQVLGTHVNKAVVGWLVCMQGPQKGQDYRLFDGRNVLGTAADCDVVVYDPFVSARHCVIMVESAKSRYLIQDLDSRNHTFVNSKQIMKQDLIDNDDIRVGNVHYRFKALY